MTPAVYELMKLSLQQEKKPTRILVLEQIKRHPFRTDYTFVINLNPSLPLIIDIAVSMIFPIPETKCSVPSQTNSSQFAET